MPIYEYECDACGQRFEIIKKFSDPLAETCAKCGKGPVHRLLSSPAIQFKGTGWYITDYAQKGKSDGASAAGKSEAKADANSDAKAETKSDAKTESKAKTDTKSETKSTS